MMMPIFCVNEKLYSISFRKTNEEQYVSECTQIKLSEIPKIPRIHNLFKSSFEAPIKKDTFKECKRCVIDKDDNIKTEQRILHTRYLLTVEFIENKIHIKYEYVSKPLIDINELEPWRAGYEDVTFTDIPYTRELKFEQFFDV